MGHWLTIRSSKFYMSLYFTLHAYLNTWTHRPRTHLPGRQYVAPRPLVVAMVMPDPAHPVRVAGWLLPVDVLRQWIQSPSALWADTGTATGHQMDHFLCYFLHNSPWLAAATQTSFTCLKEHRSSNINRVGVVAQTTKGQMALFCLQHLISFNKWEFVYKTTHTTKQTNLAHCRFLNLARKN